MEAADVNSSRQETSPVRQRRGASALQRARYGNWAVWTVVVPPFGLLLFFVLWPAIYLAYLSLLKWDGLGPVYYQEGIVGNIPGNRVGFRHGINPEGLTEAFLTERCNDA